MPLTLDVTDQASIDAAVAAASDTTIVINNARIYSHVDSLTDGTIEDIRQMFEVNFFGAIRVTRGFAPILGANGGGAVVNVHSVLSWRGAAGLDVPKNTPAAVVADTFNGLEAGEYEVLGDEVSVNVKAALSGKIEDLYPQLARS